MKKRLSSIKEQPDNKRSSYYLRSKSKKENEDNKIKEKDQKEEKEEKVDNNDNQNEINDDIEEININENKKNEKTKKIKDKENDSCLVSESEAKRMLQEQGMSDVTIDKKVNSNCH